MASIPPKRSTTPVKSSKQSMSSLQILTQMGFPKHRAEKAMAATGHKGVQLSTNWLLSHVNDPLLDDNSPREYILYCCPTGQFLEKLQAFWEKSKDTCGWNGAHNFIPHITLVSFFKAPDEDCLHLAQGLQAVMERQGAMLNEALKLETYTSPNFMGFFVAEEHADYLKRIAMQYVKEVSNATISLEPHVKSLHLTLAYQFPNSQYSALRSLVDELDPGFSEGWELRLYSRDPRVNSKQVHKVINAYNAAESDELDLNLGDYIFINSEAISASADGWVEGTSWLTGQSGLLPESYTERTAESDSWTLHKKVSLNKASSIAERSLFRDFSMSKSINGSDKTSSNGCTQSDTNIQESVSEADKNARSLFIVRHGERIDFTFGSWIPFCFNEAGIYVRKDLNMPKTLPQRTNGSAGFMRDSPLTNVGVYQAILVGECLKDKNIDIDYAYSSPSLRCIQTCDGILRGLGIRDKVKIRVEPGLFEWLAWYQDNMPDWMTVEEFNNADYDVDVDYKPLVNENELKTVESCDQYYLRKGFISREILAANPTGNILLVGHSSTLETCSHELLGRKPKAPNDLIKQIQKVPYCSLSHLSCVSGRWDVVEPPSLPLTHSNNQKFDWKMLSS